MRIVSIAMVLISCGALAGSPPVVTDWPQWGGPEREFSVGPGPEMDAWPEFGPAVAWQRKLGPGYSAIVGDRERLFTMTRRGDREVVVALSAKDGRTVWEFDYEAVVPRGEHLDTSWGSGPNSTPLLAEGRLYTLGYTGKAHCLDARTGKPLWARDLAGQEGGSISYFGIASSPIRFEELAIFFAGRAFALELETGRVRWRNDDFETSYASPILVDDDGRPLLVAGVAGEVVGLDPVRGELLWRVEHANQHRTILSSPVAGDDGWLFVSAYFLGSIGLRREAESDAYTKRWNTPQMQLSHVNAVRAGNLVFGFHNSILTAIEMTTGEILWRRRGLERGNLLQVGERTLLLGEKGGLSLLTLGRDGVVVHGTTRILNGRSWTAPAVIGSRLYARDVETILAIDLDRPASGPRIAPSAVTVSVDAVAPEQKRAFLAAKRALSEAYYRADASGLEQSRETFAGWTDDPRLAHLAEYYIGFSFWQQSLAAPREQRVRLVDSAVEHLTRATAIERWFADAHALLGKIYPSYYRLAPQRAAVIAMKGDEHLETAMDLAPDDPRVVAIQGLDLFYSPADHGGDLEAGLALVEQALKMFENATPENSELDPDWGHAVVWAWYAQALLGLADPRTEEAETAARRALAIAPEFAYARSLIEGGE